LFQQNRDGIVFDKSSKIYSAILLGLTTFVSGITYFGTKARIFGGILIGIFAIYVGSIAWQISKGRVTAPELSDSDDESSADSDSDSDLDGPSILNSETDPLLHRPESDSISGPPNRKLRRRPHSLTYHIAFLLLGFLGIVLSSYVLAHASSTITEELNLSDMLFGVIILSIATTLPEKFIAVISGLRGHEGILVANTVGGNIFLLSLCMGILLVVTTGEFDAGSVNAVELGVMWGSTLALFGTVWFGGKWCRWIGVAMLGSYLLFLVLEVAVIRGLKQ
jgi:Ca2+/H+ antiporter